MFRKTTEREHLFRKAFLRRERESVKERRRSIPPSQGRVTLWGVSFLWSSFFLVGVYALLFSPLLSVDEIVVEGESILPQIEYESFVKDSLAQKVWGVFPRKNYLMIPTATLETELIGRYPKLRSVSISRRFPHGLHLRLEERPKIVLWCSGGPCYVFEEGVVRLRDAAFDQRYTEHRLIVVDESATPVIAGEDLSVDPYLSTFAALFQEFPRVLGEALQPIATTPSRHSSELRISTIAGWSVLVSTEALPNETIAVLLAFLEEYAEKNRDQEKPKLIDLRVSGKVFYNEQ
jgi:cell division septal protein FtsQ